MNTEKFFAKPQILSAPYEGQKYYSITQLCELLGIDYSDAYRQISEDELLADSLKQLMPLKDNNGNEVSGLYMCLPEKLVYGWLLSQPKGNSLLHDIRLDLFCSLYDFMVPLN